jgi:hypothetical protein
MVFSGIKKLINNDFGAHQIKHKKETPAFKPVFKKKVQIIEK